MCIRFLASKIIMFSHYQKISRFLGNITTIVLLTIVVSFGFVSFAHAATTTLSYTGDPIDSWTVPQGVTSLTVSLTAGGGGGAGGAFTFGGGGGGGAGASFSQTISVYPGQIIAYVVGAGGVGGTSGFINFAGGSGNDGGYTTFGTTTAFGGKGGQGATYGHPNGGQGGLAGGIGGNAGTKGDDYIGQRSCGGNGGSSLIGNAGLGGCGASGWSTLPTAGTNGAGGGAGSGWAYYEHPDIKDAGANGGNGLIVLSYTQDLVAPIITILGSNPLTLEASSTEIYIDAGATAFDDVDGTTTATTTFNNVNLAATGTYSVVYSATDKAGNTATSTRIVNVVDDIAPVITAPDTQVFEATGATTTPILIQAVATDGFDPNPVITYNPHDFTLGTTTVVWTATDSSGNSATTSSLVVIKDTTAPAIVLNGSSTMSLMIGDTYTELGATAYDLVDGTTIVNTIGTVDTNATGTYQILYTSSDNSGNTAITSRTVIVTATPDTTAPVITILGNNPETITLGSIYTDAGATALDNIDGDITSRIASSSDVNTSATGTYSVIYTVSDNAGNGATSTRIVDVVATAPILSSISISPLNPTLAVSATTTFVATTLDQYGNPFATTTAWNSSNTSVGTIDASGIFTALSEGTTTVTGTTGTLSTSTMVTVTPVSVLDTTAPTTPVITGVSATSTIVNPAIISWTDSTDSQSGLAGYLYEITIVHPSMIATTTGGLTFITATTTSFDLASITSGKPNPYWFNVAAIDNAGNISTTTSYGPLLVSDSQVLIENSNLGGTFYTIYSPTLVNSLLAPVATTTGTTTITNSTLSTFWDVNNSSITNTTINDVNLDAVTVTNSTLINSDIARCIVINSLVKNYYARDCHIAYSVLDPSTLYDFINSTSTNSQIYASDIYDSVISNHSYIATSTITGSTIDSSTITLSTIATSTITGSVIANSDITLSTITDSTVSSSTLTNVVSASSTITNTVLSDATTTNAVIHDGIIDSGTIIIGGNTYVITTPTLISSLVPTVVVTLASTTPVSGNITVGQSSVDLAEFTFTNNSATSGEINQITLTRTGSSTDTTLSNVYLYQGSNQIASGILSSGQIVFLNNSGLFTIASNTSVTVAIKADVSPSANVGNTIGFSLTQITAHSLAVSAVFPLTGSLMTVVGTTSVPVTSILVNWTSEVTTVDVGSTLQMTATVNPSNATNKNVIWSVANGTGSATIDSTGVLTGVATGTVMIAASSTDGSGVFGTTTITVIPSGSLVPVITVIAPNPSPNDNSVLWIHGAHLGFATSSYTAIFSQNSSVVATTSISSTNPSGSDLEANFPIGISAGVYQVSISDQYGTSNSFDLTVTSSGTVIPTLSSITITTPADKLIYTLGDSLDITGLVVTGTYSDGSTSTEPLTLADVSGFDSSAASSSETLTVTYQTQTTSYNVAINPTLMLDSIAITHPADKLIYTVGDSLDITGLVVTGTYSDGSTSTLPVSVSNIFGFDSSIPNPSETLTIAYEGKYVSLFATATYTITINAGPSGPIAVTGVTVSPTSLNLTAGGATGNLTASVIPSNATNQNIFWNTDNAEVATVSSGVVTPIAAGIANITVTTEDGSFVATSTVTVTATSTPPPTLQSIAITSPATKLSYNIGDTLDITGLAVTGTYSDGSTSIEPISVSNISGFDSSAANPNEVLTVTVSGLTTNYTVVINAGSVSTPVLSSISISASPLTLAVGSTTQFTATTLDQFGDSIQATVNWSSSDTLVGDIDASGLFTASATGTTVVTGTAGTYSATITVTVSDFSDQTPVLSSISISAPSLTLAVGSTTQFTATTLDQFGDSIQATVNWSSSDTLVGDIDASGLFTASATGTTVVTGTAGATTISATVTVSVISTGGGSTPVPTLSSIAITSPANKLSYNINDSLDITDLVVTGTYSDGSTSIEPISVSNISGFDSSTTTPSEVLTINVSGLTTTYTITVNAGPSGPIAVTGVTVSPTSLNLTAGGATGNLTASVIPSNATNQNIFWNTDNAEVATVSSGVVTPIAAGTANITVTTVDGGFVATSTVTVSGGSSTTTPVLTSITISPLKPTIVAGNKKTFTGTTLDQDGNPFATAIAWQSSNTSIGTINSSGIFTAVSAGTTTITATAGTLSASTVATVTSARNTNGGGGATNNTPPTIVIIGDNPATITVGGTYIDAGANAFDSTDNTITSRIITSNNVNTAMAGTYTVYYSVTDSYGNTTTATRMVNVIGSNNNGTNTNNTVTSETSQTNGGESSNSSATLQNNGGGTEVTSGTGNGTIPFIDLGNILPSKVSTTTYVATSTASSGVAQVSTSTKAGLLAAVGLALSSIPKNLIAIILSILVLLIAGYIIYKIQED